MTTTETNSHPNWVFVLEFCVLFTAAGLTLPPVGLVIQVVAWCEILHGHWLLSAPLTGWTFWLAATVLAVHACGILAWFVEIFNEQMSYGDTPTR